MAVEIERKFIVASDAWRAEADAGLTMRQGYLCNAEGVAVRVRVAGESAWLTLKGATRGISRSEFEYVIPASDAEQMLESMCDGPLIEKQRFRVPRGAHVWEVDVFAGDNAGLVLAEIELSAAEEDFERPPWVGLEVSHDPRYFNAQLVRHPFCRWKETP